MKKTDIRKLTFEELEDYFENIGEKSFRARQVYEWLWSKSVWKIDQMTNLSKNLRDRMKEEFAINHIEVDHTQQSRDGTLKNVIKLHDGKIVESVLIPTRNRMTACISSQVGCSLDCHFCATGRLKIKRNLHSDEIYDQVVVIKQQAEELFGRPLTNIVYMGMGEPLLNYHNLLQSIRLITSPNGLGMSPQRITVSTVGIPKMIRKLANEGIKFKLAVSLHSSRDEIRSEIMPINRSNSLQDLGDALRYWYDVTGSMVTYEYVVWDQINDTEEDVRALIKFCRIIPSKVNLIQYNPIDDERFRQASEEKVNMYTNILENAGIVVKVRKSRGQDIDAACGQLANKDVSTLSGDQSGT